MSCCAGKGTPPTATTQFPILVLQQRKSIFPIFILYNLKNDTKRHYVIDWSGFGHWHLFTVFNNSRRASFCWATIWLKGYATLIVPFCGQSQQGQRRLRLRLRPSHRHSSQSVSQAAHRSYFVWFFWLALIASRDLLPLCTSVSLLFIFLSIYLSIFCVGNIKPPPQEAKGVVTYRGCLLCAIAEWWCMTTGLDSDVALLFCYGFFDLVALHF